MTTNPTPTSPPPTTIAETSNDDEDAFYDDIERSCWQCGGEGWGIVGHDWASDDPINGPYDGDIQQCPCCRGSGDANDCTYW